LTEPNDLAEEVIRLEGYENLPSTLPKPPSGRTGRTSLLPRPWRRRLYRARTGTADPSSLPTAGPPSALRGSTWAGALPARPAEGRQAHAGNP
ncbi:hypothetical protein ABZY09_31975, partial [Streptomyces sp. NPDC002928]|uniref:hypothetical protein n=1 Tax=Streptomyces sp. NPDC002928 TaxID=3154440 RepID=UPI0033AF3351